jgi:hypothetical protein
MTHPLVHIHQERKIATKIAAKIASVKARLHGRLLLQFKLRFSPFGGCEEVDEL